MTLLLRISKIYRELNRMVADFSTVLEGVLLDSQDAEGGYLSRSRAFISEGLAMI